MELKFSQQANEELEQDLMNINNQVACMKDDWQTEQMIVVELQKELNKREELITTLHDNEDFHKKMIDDLKQKLAAD